MEDQAWRPSISMNPQRPVSSEPLSAMELANSRHFIAQRRNCGYDLGDEVGDEVGRRQRFDRGRRNVMRARVARLYNQSGFPRTGEIFLFGFAVTH
jgi:hypothetical protein